MSAIRFIRVGFWKPNVARHAVVDAIAGFMSAMAAPLPDVRDYVDPHWSPSERDAVLHHLAHEPYLAAAEYGTSACRLCGQENGSKEYADGTYLWPEGFLHYIKDHAVKPPDAFIDHVKKFARRQAP